MKIQKVLSEEVHRNESLLKEFEEVARKANKNPGRIIDTWIKNSDKVLIAREEDQIAGFCTYKSLPRQSVIYILSMIIDPAFQRKGIAKRFTAKIIKSSVFDLRNFTLGLKILFNRKFFLVLRTQTPLVYLALSKRFATYPDFRYRNKDKKVLDLALQISSLLWPGVTFDIGTFTLLNAHKEIPSIGLKYRDVQWTGNRLIDQEFQRRLKFSRKERCLNTLLVICEMSLFNLLKKK